APTQAPPEAAPAAAPVYNQLRLGDRFPNLSQTIAEGRKFSFGAAAGRYQLFGLFLSADDPAARAAIDAVAARRDLFDDRHAAFMGVSVSRRDFEVHGLTNAEPGVRYVRDFDRSVSTACGATPLNVGVNATAPARRMWILVDPSMRVLQVWPLRETPVEEVIAAVEALPPPDRFGGASRPAPILMLPNVLEPELCRRLIDLYEQDGGQESGVHRNGGLVIDPGFKRRRDMEIVDRDLIDTLNNRLARRVTPEIEKLFFMRCRFVERHIVGCYSAADGGHFAPHTDNGPGLTAHRRFAVSINLCGGFEGGETVFPEYNNEGYKAPPGWAVVFPCAILHAVKPVTAGVRYAFLPFVYDDSGQAIRLAELEKAGLA
ncbi:MAG: 2OG-Fe(II) oxygenase, partial [Proteobacteria bacterium]|nr:2OG-Fe(II) oxygenase [Pseudomonadota bacterium]